MFVAAVLSFIAGIYIQALYSFSLKTTIIWIVVLIPLVPLLFKKGRLFSALFVLACFMLAGMIRLGILTTDRSPVIVDDGKDLYEGLVLEASQHTKIIKILKPHNAKGAKAVFRTTDKLNINDRIKVFGQLRELTLTFKNPYLTTWKWLKRLEGIEYEIRGALVSVSFGQHFVHAWRNFLKERIDAAGAKYSGVIKALTIGDTTDIDDTTKDLFLKTGTSHILAISGSNIGIVMAFFFFIARFLIRRSPVLRLRGDDVKYASIISIPFAFMFMITAGSGIPTIRATIMITIFMLSLVLERGKNIINTIALSALIILLIYPHSLFMPTFQLTFMSVLFIAIFSEKFYPLIKVDVRAVKWILSMILMTVSAILGTLPIVIYHFYGINPFSVVHNLVAVPLMCVVAMPLSLVGMATPFFGEYLLRVSGEIISLTTHVLNYLNTGYIYPIIRPNLFEIALYFGLTISLIYAGKRLVLAGLIFIVLPISAIHTYLACESRFHNKLNINFLDVGLGDAVLIEAPQGKRMLIDAGGYYKGDYDTGKSIITPILLSKKILTLDYVVNTHPHGDHAGGLIYILNNFHVKAFATGGYFLSDVRFIELLQTIREKHIDFRTWKQGDTIDLSYDVRMLVMNPQSKFMGENLNNASLVLKLIHKNTSFLFTGDIGSDIEEKLILSNMPLKSNILKIPHHGSKNSSSVSFLYAVRPDIAVLSVGSGNKALPSDEALDRYGRLSIPVLRTDVNGFIRIGSDGDKITYYRQ